jgi:hypothetical protein
MELRDEIQHTINRYSRENNSNTPDFILANYLYACLVAFEDAVNNRSDWYSRHDTPGQAPTPAPALREAVEEYILSHGMSDDQRTALRHFAKTISSSIDSTAMAALRKMIETFDNCGLGFQDVVDEAKAALSQKVRE